MKDRVQARTRPVRRYAPLALWLGLLAFYLGSLGPTVLWGDHAYFQRTAYEGLLRPDGGGHWLWLQVARLFVGLPVGSIAYRANLLSAVAALTTLALLYSAIRALGMSRASASIACVSLAVSHTFWMHSVRAEVYTVFTAVMALELLLWFRWRSGSSWPAHLAAALFGLALLAHQMAVLLFPAALFLLWKRRHWFGEWDWLVHLGCFLVGLVPFFAVVSWQVPAGNLLISLRLYFTQAGADFSSAILDISLSLLPRDLAMWVGLLGLQFVGPAGLLGLYGLSGSTLSSNRWMALLILYITSAVFALTYHVNDQFAFYLPSYVAFSLFVAKGFERFSAAPWPRPRLTKAMVMLLVIVVPVSVYAVLPRGLLASGLNPLGIRTLPGREPNRYFLWPASRGDYGALTYSRAALAGLPTNSVLIADHTPLEPLRYAQVVDGIRWDVQLVKVEPMEDLGPVLSSISPQRAVFVADINPDYYALDSLRGACAVPFGNVYQLVAGISPDLCE